MANICIKLNVLFLLPTGPDDKRRIEQLVTATKATEKALKIVSDISINPLLIEDPEVI